MKLFIILYLTATSAFAQPDFLNKSEEKRVNNYMDYICADTYCGGDINFYPQGIVCEGSLCTADFKAFEYSENTFNITSTKEAIGTKKTLKSTQIEYTDLEIEEDRPIVSFICIMPNLTNVSMSISEKEQLIYDLIVWECIRDFETTTL
jgi:hypothetical protein